MPRWLRFLLLTAGWLVLSATAAPIRADPHGALGECAGARPIADVRRLPAGSLATVRGVVTVPTGAFSDGQSAAVQDATGGLYLYHRDGLAQTLAIGDEVCAMGRLAEYHGLLELLPISAGHVTRLGHAAVPAPQKISAAALGEATEGRLVSIAGTVSGLGERRLRLDGAPVYVYPTTGVTLAGLKAGCPATIVGFSGDYDGAQLLPRGQTDITPGACSTATQPAAQLLPDATVAGLQGAGDTTPFDADARFRSLTACITGVTTDGFFVQSETPDADPRTSEGIYVFRFGSWSNPRGLKPGNRVTLHGFGVQEFYGETEIVKLAGDTQASYEVTGRCDLPTPAAIPALADPATDPVALYEPFEGMRVALRIDGSVVGPTARYASRYPAGDPEIILADRASPFYGQRILETSLPAGRGTLALSGALGVDLPDVGAFDRISAPALTGVLAYRFEQYVLLVDDPAPLRVEDVPDSADPEPPIGPDEFALCTFNLENLFDAEDDGDGDIGDWSAGDAATFRAWIAARAAVIRDDLQGCTAIGVQEVEGKDAVWAALAEAIGPRYRYDYFESMDVRDITVGLLYDADRVTINRADQPQVCSAEDYGVDYAAARGPRARANPCAASTYPVFDRPPYVADLTVRDAAGGRALEVRAVVVHLKSKRGDEAANAPRRIAQARFVAGLLTGPNAVALGDFNDVLGSEPLAQFPAAVNLYERHLAPADRYTYIYQGRAEAIDHLMMTPGLDAYFLSGGPVHINADFPETRAATGRSSDHDPLLVRFSFRPTGVSDALLGAVTGGMTGSRIERR